jgi:DNA-binding MarR family transcriptional regulator
MRLENEIQQRKFSSEMHKLAVNILYTHGWLVSLLSEALKPHDITLAQFNILRILRGQYPNPATISLLKERMLDKMSDASRLVERLRVKGLVERAVSDHDRRKANVRITPQGLRVLEEIGDFDEIIAAMEHRVSKQDSEQVNIILDSLRDIGLPGVQSVSERT